MKNLIIWLLLFTSFTANAQLIGGGPRKPKGGGSTGTVTSVGLSVPTGLTVSGSPVTGAGTLALSLASGYSIPTTANQTNWTTAYGWGNHAGLYASLTGSNTFSAMQSFTANWSDYQATFGSTGQGGRIQFINGTGFQAGVIGTLTSSSTIFRVGTPLDLDLLSTGANVVIANNNASGAIYIRASGTTNGNIRFQTGATESGRVFTNGNWLIGSDGVDDGSKLRVQGLLTTQGINSSAGIVCGGNILPSTNNNLSIGNSSNTYLAGFFQSLYTGVASRAFNIAQTGLNAIVFRVHPTTGNIVIQSPGVAPPDDGVNQLQVLGSTISTQYRLSALNTAPASATATGTLGEIRVTAGYIYVCTATNTWVRAALATW